MINTARGAGSERGITIGIDASRNRSGGAKVHLVGILGSSDPSQYGIDRVHVWSYDTLLAALPDREWLVKHSPSELSGPLTKQALWQRRRLPVEARVAGVDILLNTDAGTLCRFAPAVVMSRDMLSYEPGEMGRYRFSKMWLRLLALRYLQAWSLKSAEGAVFLTEYASRVIQQMTGPLRRTAVIPHGVSSEFRGLVRHETANNPLRVLRCIYVSQADLYKHQWVVVRALADLRARGYNLSLQLAGGGQGRGESLLQQELRLSDPVGEWVTVTGFVPPSGLPALLASSDIFIFASSCENMPNTLVEGMAAGLPIACSDRGPMPEVLKDGGLYFDPEDASSIAAAVQRLADDPALRMSLAGRAAELATAYSWERCARETWQFLTETFNATRRPSVASR